MVASPEVRVVWGRNAPEIEWRFDSERFVPRARVSGSHAVSPQGGVMVAGQEPGRWRGL